MEIRAKTLIITALVSLTVLPLKATENPTASELSDKKRPSAWDLLRKHRQERTEPVGSQSTGRVVHFPNDQSIGRAFIVEPQPEQTCLWHRVLVWPNRMLGHVRSDVTVPAGKILRLDVWDGGPKAHAALAGLGPDDVQILNFYQCKGADDRMLTAASRLTGLKVVFLGQGRFTHRGLGHLAGFKDLRALQLPSNVPTESLRYLKGLTSLDYLNISGPELTLAKMARVGQLPWLTQLSIAGHGASGGLKHIANLRSLRYLNLAAVTDPNLDVNLAHIADLTDLEEIDFEDSMIGDAGLAHLAGLAKLKKLHIRSNPATNRITDVGLGHLRNLKSLEKINLPFTRITDVGVEYLTQIESLKEMNPYGDDITDKVMEKIAKMKSLENVGLRSDNITDAGMAQLAQFANLKSLDLNGCHVTNAGLASLTKMKMLNTLTITKTGINGEGLAVLKEFPDLAELNLLFMTLGDKRISCLTNLPKLKKLWLAYSDFGLSDEDLAHLGRMASLENLDIRLTADHPSTVTNDGLKHLSNLRNLTFLRLPGNISVTDEGLKHISNLIALKQVWVNNSPITDAGLKYFENMTLLTYLTITKSHVTEKGKAQLEMKIPGLYCNFSR